MSRIVQTQLRPNDGDSVTIYGGLFNETMMGTPMIVVYSINGEYWRDPFDPFWTNFGHHMHGGGMMDSCHTFSWGWNDDSLQTVTIQGTAMVDSTFMMTMYYLDENNDNVPDYVLNFGPPWYEPESGATRPEDGDQITIVGGKIDMPNYSMVVVYEINGMQWFDSTEFGNHFGGGWIHSDMNQPRQFHSSFDNNDMMEINPGWHSGMMMPDSLFCRILEVYPQNAPSINGTSAFAAYEIAMFNPNGSNLMWQNGNCGGNMQFNSSTMFQMHYSDAQIANLGINENTIGVKYYNYQDNSWVNVSGVSVDPNANTVTFNTNNIQTYYILSADNATGVNGNNNSVVKSFNLFQNYPNPFNPSTTIKFELNKNTNVKLSVYNILGQKLFDLVNGQMQSGVHEVNFDASNLSSGIYLYRIQTEYGSKVMKMELLK